jgi:flagellar assembly protein FliH
MLELLEEWAAPDVTEHKKQEFTGRTNFMGVPLDKLYSQHIQEEEVEEEVKPLTAEEIEQIRQDAYNEGFAQGKDEGFVKGEEDGLEQGRTQGLELGHQEGFEAGFSQGQEQVNMLIERWQHLTHQLYNPVEKMDRIAEQQLLNLAVMLAESVIRQESKINKDALFTVLDEAVASLPFNTEYAEIHMHPTDIALLQELYNEEAIVERKWLLKEEPSYQVGDVIVMTPNSLIDRSIKQRIKQSLDTFVAKIELDKEIDASKINVDIPVEDLTIKSDEQSAENARAQQAIQNALSQGAPAEIAEASDQEPNPQSPEVNQNSTEED